MKVSTNIYIGDFKNFNPGALSSAEALPKTGRKAREKKRAEPLQENVRFFARKSRFLASATATTV